MTGIDHQPLEIRLLYHRFQHFFPDALVSPATETPLDSIPLTIFRRQVSPWCSRSQNPEHAIEKLTGILCVPSPRSLVSYCVRLENFPHRIGHIVPSIAVLHEETPLCVFLHYTTKRHFCRQCLALCDKMCLTKPPKWSYDFYMKCSVPVIRSEAAGREQARLFSASYGCGFCICISKAGCILPRWFPARRQSGRRVVAGKKGDGRTQGGTLERRRDCIWLKGYRWNRC